MSMRGKMSAANPGKIRLGLSPCPNDTFIFHALLAGKVSAGIEIEPVMADVEKLNGMALRGELEATKLSLGVVPHILDKYRLLASGAALGWGCGPLLVARNKVGVNDLKNAGIAIPGKMTTANLLLDLHGGFQGPRIEMLFSDVMDAVAGGKADAGLIIHEGRFTYAQKNLCEIIDLGQWWEEKFHLPLPLGAIAARADLDRGLALDIQKAIAASLAHAWKNPGDSKDFVRENAKEMSEEVTSAHIKTFVTSFSQDLGAEGKAAIQALLEKGSGKELPLEKIFLQ